MQFKGLGRIALVSLFAVAAAAALAVNDKKVVINPILVAADDGSGRADFAAYTDYAQKIWDQAGITLEFLAPTLLDDDDYYTFDEDNAVALVTGAGGGQSGDPKVINAWFVDTIINASVYGFAFLDFPYMVMDVSNIQGYSALGRVDTFSHELGHVLNLGHFDTDFPGESDPEDYLMSSGGIRNIPQDLGDVNPDGLGWDKLHADEIAIARGSQFVQAVPEPATIAALSLGLLAVRRRRR